MTIIFPNLKSLKFKTKDTIPYCIGLKILTYLKQSQIILKKNKKSQTLPITITKPSTHHDSSKFKILPHSK